MGVAVMDVHGRFSRKVHGSGMVVAFSSAEVMRDLCEDAAWRGFAVSEGGREASVAGACLLMHSPRAWCRRVRGAVWRGCVTRAVKVGYSVGGLEEPEGAGGRDAVYVWECGRYGR